MAHGCYREFFLHTGGALSAYPPIGEVRQGSLPAVSYDTVTYGRSAGDGWRVKNKNSVSIRILPYLLGRSGWDLDRKNTDASVASPPTDSQPTGAPIICLFIRSDFIMNESSSNGFSACAWRSFDAHLLSGTCTWTFHRFSYNLFCSAALGGGSLSVPAASHLLTLSRSLSAAIATARYVLPATTDQNGTTAPQYSVSQL